MGTRGGAVGWGTALQAGKSRFRFPNVTLVDWASNRNEYQEYFLGGKFQGGPVRRADNFNTFMCQLSGNLGA
jgi:hypothetical protein